ncbi:MAG: dienelactone hydrolase family protein, partial [Gammaproteobacteria bacterium]|nr:dienelactone hydrolase family protein [Gammaproteobacteria bacterium]
MIDAEIDIVTQDGSMNTFISHPEEGGPYPVILFLMDAPGYREELHDMARRIATAGYYVMLPNLYYRRTRALVVNGAPESREIMFGHMNSLSNAMVVEDCKTLLDFAASQPFASDGAAGCTGYCMSGPFAFSVAAKLADRVKASASFHGVRLCIDTMDSPHLDADKIQGEMYFGMAETDDWAPPEMVEALDKHMQTSGANYRI